MRLRRCLVGAGRVLARPAAGPPQEELEEEENEKDEMHAVRRQIMTATTAAKGRAGSDSEDSDADSDGFGSDGEPGELGSDQEYEVEEVEISPEDEAALRAFMVDASEAPKQRTLADLILERIREKQRAGGVEALPEEADEGAGVEPPLPQGLDPRVVEVYKAVGDLMKR